MMMRQFTVALLLATLCPAALAANPSWSAISSGSSKNAAAGFIAPFGRQLIPVESTGSIPLCFERVLGETGSIAITLTTYSAFNVEAGKNYTALSGTTLSWADGQVGVQCTTLTVSAMPTGPGIIGITLGGNNYRDRDYVLLNNGTVYPSAKYVAPYQNGSTDSSSQTSGSGTIASPYLNPSYALSTMTGGGLLYMRSGTYRDWKRYSGEAYSGINIPPGSRSNTTPLIVMPYPGEAVTIDQNYGGSSDGAGYNTSSGFVFRSGSGNSFILGPITVQHCSGAGVDDDGKNNDVVLYGLTFQDIVGSQVTEAGIHIYASQNWLIQDNVIQRIYATQNGTSNPFDSYPARVSNGVQIFGAQNYSLIKNTFDVVDNALEIKGAPQTDTDNNTYDMSHNLFLRILTDPVIYLGYQYSGATGGISRSLIRYNVSDNPAYATAPTDGFVQTWTQTSSSAPQATGLQIYNNVLRNMGTPGGSNPIIQLVGVQDVQITNNIIENSKFQQIGVGNMSGRTDQIGLSDYNDYYNGNTQWVLPGNTSSSLAAWKTVTANAYIARSNPDTNAVGIQPVYTSPGKPSYDYRITTGTLATAGRLGQPIGVGNETVGAFSTDYWSVLSPPSAPTAITLTPIQQ